MDRDALLHLLRDEPLDALLARADATRREAVGDVVHLRGLVEFSNVCVRNCLYCGLRAENRQTVRYRLTVDEVLAAAQRAVTDGADTIVLQGGEVPGAHVEEIARMTARIKDTTGAAVTLSLGEHPTSAYRQWRQAGADRYLIKHETADPALYARLHPGDTLAARLDAIARLQDLGFMTGSGFIIGLPGQTLETLAEDIRLVKTLGVEMCGAGPFIPQTQTPLARAPRGSAEQTLRVTAALRLCVPGLHIPATTALATLDPAAGQLRALMAGANVLMPGYTPEHRRRDYRIYDGKHAVAMDEARRVIAQAGRAVAPTMAAPGQDHRRSSCSIPPRACACTSACSADATPASPPC